MDISDAAALLKDMYKEGGRRRERAVFVPLFGIKYAKEAPLVGGRTLIVDYTAAPRTG